MQFWETILPIAGWYTPSSPSIKSWIRAAFVQRKGLDFDSIKVKLNEKNSCAENHTVFFLFTRILTNKPFGLWQICSIMSLMSLTMLCARQSLTFQAVCHAK